MPNLSSYFYNFTNLKKSNHYIETGTYLGHGIKNVLNNYDSIHSIELSDNWYNFNVEKLKNCSNVKMYLGDSKKILPEILKNINEPMTIFLDAHYSGGRTSFGDEEVPLLFELEILKNRTYNDIIIINDCRLLGKSGQLEISPWDPIYHTMNYDWTDITENKIKSLMKNDYVLLKNDNQIFTDGPEDQFILFAQKKE